MPIFDPRLCDIRYYKTTYPELGDIPEFSKMGNKELALAWYYSCKSSPLSRIKDNRDRIVWAIKEVYAGDLESDIIEETKEYQKFYVNQTDQFKKASEYMGSFDPNARERAKSMADKIFDDYEKILNEPVESFKSDKEIDYKKYLDVRKVISNELDDLVKIKERGYGVLSEKKIKLRTGQEYITDFHTNEKQ